MCFPLPLSILPDKEYVYFHHSTIILSPHHLPLLSLECIMLHNINTNGISRQTNSLSFTMCKAQQKLIYKVNSVETYSNSSCCMPLLTTPCKFLCSLFSFFSQQKVHKLQILDEDSVGTLQCA